MAWLAGTTDVKIAVASHALLVGLALVFAMSPALAQFATTIDNVTVDGKDLRVDLSVLRSGGCNPKPEFSAKPGSPAGAGVEADAASFIVVIDQPRAVCTRAFRTEKARLKLRVAATA